MQPVPRPADSAQTPASTVETIELPAEVVERIRSGAGREHPAVHPAFALPHFVRTLLDRLIANEDSSATEGESSR